jgi:hypothetical protein
MVEKRMLPVARGVMGKARSRMEVTMPKVPVMGVRVQFCIDMISGDGELGWKRTYRRRLP